MIVTAAACSSQAATTAAPAPQPQSQAKTETTTVVVPSTPAALPVPGKQPAGPIKATWINATVDNDTVTIPLSAVYNNWDTHFKVQIASGTETFMAYLLNNTVYVRANICPPCRSIGFSLKNDILVCDACGTTFQAKTGAGIAGACVAFPKAPVQYKIVNNNVVMNVVDLASAYQKTVNGKGLS